MQQKTGILALLVCAMMAASIFAAAGIVIADGVNASVNLGEEKSGTLTAPGKIDYFYLTLGTGYTKLTVKTYTITGTNDFDLYIKRGAYPTTSSYDARAYTSSSAETISLSNPASGTYYVMVYSYSGSGTYKFMATGEGGTSVTPLTLDSGYASSSVSATGDKKYFSVAVPSGKTALRIETFEPASGFDIDLYVKLGALPTTSSYDGRGYTSSSAEVVTINNPAAGTYYIMVNSYSGGGTFKVKATSTGASDTTAPTISGMTATSITTSGATITWTTNEAATSIVEYGLTTSYGSTATSTTLKTSHSVALTGLNANTKYYYRVKSADAAGNVATSSGSSFTTQAAADTTPPTISSIAVSSITTSGATVTWTTNEASSSVVEYGTTTSYGLTKTGSSGVTSHSVALSSLSAGTKYYYRVKSTDAAGNTATSTGSSFTTAGSSSSSTLTLDGSGLSGSVSATGDKKYFTVVVPTGKATLKVETYNTVSGYDIDLYVKLGSQPTTSSYDGRGYTSSSNEVVTINNPAAGTYHIMVYSYNGAGTFSVKATSTTSTGGGDGSKLALCIGISDYKTINDLSYAHKDAQEWGAYLQGKGYTVTTLLNSQATEAAIYTAIDNIIAQATATTKVVITFSGHGGHQSEGGYTTSAGTTYGGQYDSHPALWFAWDASGYGAGCVLDNVFSYRLRNLASTELFVFMDECRSGGMDEVGYRYTTSGYDANCGRYIAQGCAWNEYTYDASQYGMGAWTYWFLKWAIQSQGSTTMEGAFSIAKPKYTSEYSDSHPEAVDNYPGSYYL